jgi:hypothetical protein
MAAPTPWSMSTKRRIKAVSYVAALVLTFGCPAPYLHRKTTGTVRVWPPSLMSRRRAAGGQVRPSADRRPTRARRADRRTSISRPSLTVQQAADEVSVRRARRRHHRSRPRSPPAPGTKALLHAICEDAAQHIRGLEMFRRQVTSFPCRCPRRPQATPGFSWRAGPR